ncbi:MAG: tRNA epoxyqueuosine(34) reductase QueG [Leptospira sp.]|nr:MAG: tRNA epoxyqueuosine(34) reductase QueG [Leptospira sp.]
MNNNIIKFESVSEIQNSLHSIAIEAGFEMIGFTEARISEKDQTNIQSFIDNNYYGSMKWFPERQNIRLRFENLGFPIASCIVLGMVYKPSEESVKSCEVILDSISKYAWGQDYHQVLKDKAKPILEFLRSQFPNYKFRQAVDSLPIPEKILARDAGLGWIGKHTILINSNYGSYFFLTVILSEKVLHLIDTEKIAFKMPSKDRCGTCTACIDACPTNAIVNAYELDSNLCISHNTIELKDPSFDEATKNHGWVYGCDICQDVCPWNKTVARKKNIHSKIEEFKPIKFFSESSEIFHELDEQDFEHVFKDSAILRIGYKNWNRNIQQKDTF